MSQLIEMARHKAAFYRGLLPLVTDHCKTAVLLCDLAGEIERLQTELTKERAENDRLKIDIDNLENRLKLLANERDRLNELIPELRMAAAWANYD